MKSCEEYEIDLSALVDGELSPQAAGEALEHAFGCASCRAFYLAARRLEKAGVALRDTAAGERAATEAGWRAVEARLGRPEARRGRLPSRALRAAALVALGLGGGYLLSGVLRPSSPAAIAPAPAVTGVAPAAATPGAVAPAPMDEHRFVALADELLRSDVRYQRAMLQVLRLVPALETGEGLRQEGEEPRGGIVRATTRRETARQGAL
jgi:hypothetical protein